MPDMAKLAADLRAAHLAAVEAAGKVIDGGSCCLDFVVLRIARAKGLTAALRDSGLRWRRHKHWTGSGISFSPQVPGQAWKVTVACETMAASLREAGWPAHVFYLTD